MNGALRGSWGVSLARLVPVFLLALAMGARAGVEVYDFSSEEGYARYQQLTFELRCPKCQNQNIADSNADISRDLRKEVHRLIEEGRSDQEIVDYMVERYGDFVHYRPPVDASTLILWVGPVVLVVVGVAAVLWWGRRRRRLQPDSSDPLMPDERSRLDLLLSTGQYATSDAGRSAKVAPAAAPGDRLSSTATSQSGTRFGSPPDH